MRVTAMLGLTCAILSAAASPPATAQSSQAVENLAAFATLYGYVRYFHPSAEAAGIDWETFAAYGAGRVRNAADRGEMQRILRELFLPVAPTVRIYSAEESPPLIPQEPQDADWEAGALWVRSSTPRSSGSKGTGSG